MAYTPPSLQSTGGFPITPSDTLDITADPGNAAAIGMTNCYVHVAGTSGLVKVVTVEGHTLSMYAAQGTILGGTLPIMVKQIFATGTAATSLIALRGKVTFQ